jgi:glycine hydroxymethyltransferase
MVESTIPLPMPDLSLREKDQEVFDIIAAEKERQFEGIELIASENFTSKAVMEALGSCLTNKYSEGYPGRRYYGGNEVIDRLELLTQKRALEAYRLDPTVWGVNVQALSGSPANFMVYTALLQPGGKILGLKLAEGGHLTHGHYTDQKRISASSHYFDAQHYRVDPATGLIDYDALDTQAQQYKPHILIAGASGYPRDFDYKRFREITDKVEGCYLMSDMAHYSGLIASGLMNSPFEYCDVVTTTTHKSLRGPRHAMIFYKLNLKDRIDFACFPMLQGGPHNAAMGALCVQLKEVASQEFKNYAQQVIDNARHSAKYLQEKGEKLITDGTDTHMIMWDLRPHGLTGSKVEKVMDALHITINKNSIVGDKSAATPGGIRLGTPAMTTRGCTPADFEKICDFCIKAIEITKRVQEKCGSKMMEDFVPFIALDEEVPIV